MTPGVGTELVGWLATALFSVSYFCKETVSLRRVQALAALAWIGYGILIASRPVVVANVIVATLALWSSWRRAERPGLQGGSGPAV